MKTRNELKQDVITEFEGWLSNEGQKLLQEEQIEELNRIIHYHIPVYTHELFEIALSNLNLATMACSFETSYWSPAEILILNINNLLQEEITEWFYQNK